ncbi:MAG: 4-alpha-glucanotransferase [Verrucomicrobia bacterium]|nr:4-alpha-glucanotransferase [Verrucomicrobiota bacterium]
MQILKHILNRKRAGILTPVFALRSENDLGIGDTQCVREMLDWCAHHRFSLLQVLPINESSDDNSPYNAISSIALDPTTIAVTPENVPDLPRNAFQELAPAKLQEELRQGPVQYRKVKPLKLRLLREAFNQFKKKHDAKNTARAAQFRAFLAANETWIPNYALFRVLMQIHDGCPAWELWPAEHQTPEAARLWRESRPAVERRDLDEASLFFSYVQWIAWQQWEALKEYGDRCGVVLMGDIPFGIGRCSADVWAHRSLFDLRWSCGAPPESFFKPDIFTEKWGQNWGIPLYRWDAMKEDGYWWWRSRVGATSRIFHLFRIDHVLGFYRIYAFPWKPDENHQFTHLTQEQARARAGNLPRFWPGDDNSDSQKQMNQQQGETLLRMVLDAAGATAVVAEDLGMVPDYVRPSLTKLGIPGFKIPLFERHQDGFYKNSSEYQPLSVATLATHDHEPIVALWNRWQTATEGASEMRHLLTWIGWDPKNPPRDLTAELHAGICKKLLACSSSLVIFMITDLFAQTQRFNVPGPASESNWTERLPLTIGQFDQTLGIASRLAALASAIGRC